MSVERELAEIKELLRDILRGTPPSYDDRFCENCKYRGTYYKSEPCVSCDERMQNWEWINSVPQDDRVVISKKETTTDAVPVVHGEWITKRTLQHDGEYYCSVCEFEAFWSWRRDVQSLTNYCPNCGAKMDGERKDG